MPGFHQYAIGMCFWKKTWSYKEWFFSIWLMCMYLLFDKFSLVGLEWILNFDKHIQNIINDVFCFSCFLVVFLFFLGGGGWGAVFFLLFILDVKILLNLMCIIDKDDITVSMVSGYSWPALNFTYLGFFLFFSFLINVFTCWSIFSKH